MTDLAGDVAVIGAVGTLIMAIAALATALWQGARTRADLGHVRRDAAVTKHEVTNNHGSSMKDAIDRIELGMRAGLDRLWQADERRAANADRTHSEIFHRLANVETRQDKLEQRLRRCEDDRPKPLRISRDIPLSGGHRGMPEQPTDRD